MKPKRCEICDTPLGRDRCTNGRCPTCHGRFCGPGGATEPGHERGNVSAHRAELRGPMQDGPVLRELENFGRTDAEAMDQLARNEAAAQRAEQERH